jgi:hypothetical protein
MPKRDAIANAPFCLGTSRRKDAGSSDRGNQSDGLSDVR